MSYICSGHNFSTTMEGADRLGGAGADGFASAGRPQKTLVEFQLEVGHPVGGCVAGGGVDEPFQARIRTVVADGEARPAQGGSQATGERLVVREQDADVEPPAGWIQNRREGMKADQQGRDPGGRAARELAV